MKVVRFILFFVFLFSLVGCGSPASKPKIALILARGGLGDKAFNDSANEGLQKSAQELNVDVATFDYQQDTQEENIRKIAQDDYGLVIALGSENSQVIGTVATEFPDTKFAIIDSTAEGANITSITFSELEGDFLAGALAALMNGSGKIGYLGGADVLVIRRIQFGFEQGVKYVNPIAEIVVKYIAGKDDFSGFAKPDEAESIATQMYSDGVDIIYAAAGGSTLGAIDAATSAHKLIITTGSDQRYLSNFVLTSRTKNMNQAVYMLIEKFVNNELQSENILLDYQSSGIGIPSPSVDDIFVFDPIVDQFEIIRSDLESGKITVSPFTGQ